MRRRASREPLQTALPALRLLHVLFRLLLTASGSSHYPTTVPGFFAEATLPRWLLLALFSAFVYVQLFHGLSNLGLVGPDEPRYAQVAREMADSGDWVTPRLHGVPWFEKPVLYYWLAGAAFKTLGVSELSARLPSAIAGLLGVLVVLGIGWRSAGWRCGLMAALILAASPLYFSLARAASTDMLLNLGLTLSFASLYFAWFGARNHRVARASLKTAWAYGYCGFLGVAILAKGPVALILAGGSLGLLLVTTSQWSLLRTVARLGPILLGLAVALPWYVLCYRVNGWGFIEEFLLNHNLARFASDRYQHPQPLWFYVLVVFAGFFPWSFQLAGPVWRGARASWKRAARRRPAASQQQSDVPHHLPGKERPGISEEWFLWSWALVPFVFFSLSLSKLPGYVLPMFPPLALLAAREWERSWNSLPRGPQIPGTASAVFWQALCVLALGVALPWSASALNVELGAFATKLAALIGGAGSCAVVLVWLRKTRLLPAVYLMGAAAITLFVTERVLHQLSPLESTRDLAAFVQQQGFRGEKIFVYQLSRRIEYGLGFYLNAPAKLIYSEADVEYPAQERFFFVTEAPVNAETVLPGARALGEAQFMGQKIVSMKAKKD